MYILVPWKPVVLLWGLLTGMILVSFVASSLLQGIDPLAPPSATGGPQKAQQASHSHKAARQIVGYLAKQCKDAGAQVEYAPITTLELVCGLLRGSAVLEAAGVGVPHRMWGKMDEHEILGLLAPDKYREIEKRTGDIEAQFQKVGISLKETDPRHLPEVWSLAKLILSWVYLEVGDVVVYTSALLAEADELLTSDGYLWDIANKIQGAGGLTEPDKTHFLKVQDDLRNALSTIIPAPIAEVVLAKPRKPNKL